MRFNIVFPTILLLMSQNVFAFNNYTIPRVTTSPTIDGKFEQNEWALASKVALAFETEPSDSVPAPVETSAYMMEDGENIYFAFIASDPNPENIRAYIRDRDGIFQDDFVGVILDTFNDERRGFEFFANPMGSQGDLTRDDSLQNEDASWDAVWDSAGQVTESGYIVEMAIPYRALRFPSGLAEQTWGIQFLRIYPRDSRSIMSDVKNDRSLDCMLCQSNKLTGMPELQTSSANVDLTPTLITLSNESRELSPETSWEDFDTTELGLDLRWAMTEDWILNATINPDFSQVEADSGQLDVNTTFSLFYPEARPFFLDGADYFRTRNRLVHTRNIADPDYGLKVTGKTNGYTLGVIAATDENTNFLIPSSLGSYVETLDESSDVFVARGQSDIGENDNVGILLTHRSATDYNNQVIAIDGKHYFTKKDILSYQFMHSETDNPESIRFDDGEELFAANQSDHAITLNFTHNEENYSFRADYINFGEDFRADMGFIGQVDYEKVIVGGNYTWYGETDSKWTRWGFFGDVDQTRDQSGKKLEEEAELHFNLAGPIQFNTNFGLVDRERFFDEQYFDETFFMMWFEVKPWSNVTIGNFMQLGDQIDFANSRLGEIQLFEPYLRWQLGKHFNINLSMTSQILDVNNEELFNADIVDLRLAYQFSNRSRLSLTLQQFNIERNLALYDANLDLDPDNDYQANDQSFGTQLIYSYKINPQSLFYFGYSDNAVKNDDVQSLKVFDRSLFAKVSYMWQH
jgi:hypothetical protein